MKRIIILDHAGKGKDYVTVDFDACLSTNLYDSTAPQLLQDSWWVMHSCAALGLFVPRDQLSGASHFG